MEYSETHRMTVQHDDLPTVDGFWLNLATCKISRLQFDKRTYGLVWQEDDDSHGGKLRLTKHMKVRVCQWSICLDGNWWSVCAPQNTKTLVFPNGIVLFWYKTEQEIVQHKLLQGREHHLILEKGRWDVRLVGAAGKSQGRKMLEMYGCASGGAGAFIKGYVDLVQDDEVAVYLPEVNESQQGGSLHAKVTSTQFYVMADCGAAGHVEYDDGRFVGFGGFGGARERCCFSSNYTPIQILAGHDGLVGGCGEKMGGSCLGADAASMWLQYGKSRSVSGSFDGGTQYGYEPTQAVAILTKLG